MQPAVASGIRELPPARCGRNSRRRRWRAESKPASLVLPQLVHGGAPSGDVASGAAVDITLNGALPVAAQTVGGYVVYPGGFGVGGTVLHRALPSGSEDFINLPTRLWRRRGRLQRLRSEPASPGSGSFRGRLEMLDAERHAPVARLAPVHRGRRRHPHGRRAGRHGCVGRQRSERAVGTSGHRAGAATARSASPGRMRWSFIRQSLTRAGRRPARWDRALRAHAAAALDGEGARGGRTQLVQREPRLSPAPSSTIRRAAPGRRPGAWRNGRRLHSMTQLGSSSNGTTSGKVLVAGGISGTTSTNSARALFAERGNLDRCRKPECRPPCPHGDLAARRAGAGRRRPERHPMLTTAALYNPASGAGSWVATTGPVPPGGLKNHTATLIQTTNTQLNNHVLLVGGNNGTSTVSRSICSTRSRTRSARWPRSPAPARAAHGGHAGRTPTARFWSRAARTDRPCLATRHSCSTRAVSNGTWSSAGR